MISPKEIGWIAGFMEGEGSFTYGNRGNIACCAAQKQLEPLERLHNLVGGKVYKYDRINSWRLNGSNAISLMMTLYGLMSPKRQQKIKECINYWHTKPISTWYKAEIRGLPRGSLGHTKGFYQRQKLLTNSSTAMSTKHEVENPPVESISKQSTPTKPL